MIDKIILFNNYLFVILAYIYIFFNTIINILVFFFCCKVLSADGQNQVGKISKQWTGLVREAFTDADNFGITCMYLAGSWALKLNQLVC